MNNILKKWGVVLVVALVVVVAIIGYLVNSKESDLEKDNKSITVDGSSEVLLASAEKRKLEYEDM